METLPERPLYYFMDSNDPKKNIFQGKAEIINLAYTRNHDGNRGVPVEKSKFVHQRVTNGKLSNAERSFRQVLWDGHL